MRRLSAALLVVLSCLSSAAAAAPGPPARPQTERERRVARALAIVDDALSSVSSLRLPQNRLRLRLSVCDALWAYDQQRARRVVDDAVADLNALAADTDDAHWRDGRSPRLVAASIRQQLIYDLMQRDAKLALDVLLKTKGVAQASGRNGYDIDRELEIQIASVLTTSDSARALDVAEKSLARGLSYNLSSVLEQARTSDPDGAAKLAGAVFDKLSDAKPLSDEVAVAVAVYLLSDGLREDRAEGSKPLLSAADQRALEEQYVGSVLTFRADGARPEDLSRAVNLANSLSSIVDALSHRSPGQGQALKKKIDELQADYNRLYGGQQVAQEEPSADATPDQIVEAAANVSEDMHDNYIYAAAERARSGGDVARARDIVAANVKDPTMRRQYTDNLDRMAFYDAVGNGRVDEARALLDKFDEPAERVQALLQIANAAGLAQRTPQSLALLAEADALTGDRAADSAIFSAKLTIAQAYVEADPARTFSILDASVDQLDTLLDAAAVMEGFGCNRQYQDGELLVFEGGSFSSLIQEITQTLGMAAHKDVDRAAETAGRFRRPESRSVALLAVAKVMFEAPPDAAPTTPDAAQPSGEPASEPVDAPTSER